MRRIHFPPQIDRILVDENHSDADLRKQLQSDRVRISSDQVVGPFVEVDFPKYLSLLLIKFKNYALIFHRSRKDELISLFGSILVRREHR